MDVDEMKIIKCYENYKELKKSLKSRTYNLINDSIGQYNNGDYSVDITLREYDEDWCVDYDVYKVNGDKKYLDGGKYVMQIKCHLQKTDFGN